MIKKDGCVVKHGSIMAISPYMHVSSHHIPSERKRIIRPMLILLHVKQSYVYPRPIYGQTVKSGKSQSLLISRSLSSYPFDWINQIVPAMCT